MPLDVTKDESVNAAYETISKSLKNKSTIAEILRCAFSFIFSGSLIRPRLTTIFHRALGGGG